MTQADVGDARTIHSTELEETTQIQRSDAAIPHERLWLRGGFPDSLLADSDDASFAWRQKYLSALCARSYAHLDPALAASSVRNFFEWIASNHGGPLDVNNLPREQRPCLAHFEDLGLIRQLRPWFGNELKRLRKPPKVYIRDSGLLHCLLRRRTHEEIRANDRVYGHSWEGFCVENLIVAAGPQVTPYFYRSDDGDEVDLVLEFPGDLTWAIEMKGPKAKVTKGFENACNAVSAVKRFVVRPVPESHYEGTHSVMTLRNAISAVAHRSKRGIATARP